MSNLAFLTKAELPSGVLLLLYVRKLSWPWLILCISANPTITSILIFQTEEQKQDIFFLWTSALHYQPSSQQALFREPGQHSAWSNKLELGGHRFNYMYFYSTFAFQVLIFINVKCFTSVLGNWYRWQCLQIEKLDVSSWKSSLF